MSTRSRGLAGSPDLEEMRLPRLVRSQLQRRRKLRGSNRAADIEERVREALYGKTLDARRSQRHTEGEHDT